MNWVYFFTYLFIFSLFSSRLWCESFHPKSRKIWILVYCIWIVCCIVYAYLCWKLENVSMMIQPLYIDWIYTHNGKRWTRTENREVFSCLLNIIIFFQKPHLLNNRRWFNSHKHMAWNESRRILSANILQSLDAFFPILFSRVFFPFPFKLSRYKCFRIQRLFPHVDGIMG